MSEQNKVLEDLTQLVHGDLKSMRDRMDSAEAGTAKFDELSRKHDMILDKVDGLKEKLDTIQTATSRLDAANEAKEENPDLVEHKEAFNSYMRTANEGNLKALEAKALSVGVDADAGFVATEEMASRILTIINETSPVCNVADVHSTSQKEVKFLVDIEEAGAGWVAEGGVIAETTTPQLAELTIKAHKMYAEPHATEEILMDADMDMEAWLSGKVGDKFGRTENTAFVNGLGDGSNQPTGFTTYAAGTAWGQIEQLTSGTVGDFDADDVIDLIGSLKTPYLQNASFAMNRLTHKKIRQLKDTNGNYLFDGQDLLKGTFLGYNVTLMEDMASVANGALPIAFGDFKKGYTIVDRMQTRILRDPYTSKGYVKFYTTRRVGGGVTNFEAIKLLKIAAV